MGKGRREEGSTGEWGKEGGREGKRKRDQPCRRFLSMLRHQHPHMLPLRHPLQAQALLSRPHPLHRPPPVHPPLWGLAPPASFLQQDSALLLNCKQRQASSQPSTNSSNSRNNKSTQPKYKHDRMNTTASTKITTTTIITISTDKRRTISSLMMIIK